MTNKPLRETLFAAHSSDLQDISPDLQGRFLCPICLDFFSPEDLKTHRLTYGHVWPKHLRARSEIAARHRVLLCSKCNSNSGARGDAHIQILQKVKLGQTSGKLYGPQRVQVLKENGESIFVEGEVSFKRDPINVSVRLSYKLNDPKQVAAFHSLTQTEETFTVLVHNAIPYRTELAQAGLITSAYLFAFYTFGYRYILSEDLDALRLYIQNSFQQKRGEQPPLPHLNLLHAFMCDENPQPNPQIGLVLPMDGQTPIHLQVTFLNYYIMLPFYLVREVFDALIMNRMPPIQVDNTPIALYIPVSCTKTTRHPCIWDAVLGTPTIILNNPDD